MEPFERQRRESIGAGTSWFNLRSWRGLNDVGEFYLPVAYSDDAEFSIPFSEYPGGAVISQIAITSAVKMTVTYEGYFDLIGMRSSQERQRHLPLDKTLADTLTVTKFAYLRSANAFINVPTSTEQAGEPVYLYANFIRTDVPSAPILCGMITVMETTQ